MEGMKKISLILLENTINQEIFGIPDRIYDLKGSLTNRFSENTVN